jgi:hypothetical protein
MGTQKTADYYTMKGAFEVTHDEETGMERKRLQSNDLIYKDAGAGEARHRAVPLFCTSGRTCAETDEDRFS